MHDRARLFLLSVAAVPACSDGTGRPSIQQSCETYISNAMQCYGDLYETDGAMDGGTAEDGTAETESYDPAQYCEAYATYYESYSEACLDAIARSWACLSRLDCATLMDSEASDAACKKTEDEGRETCPELYPYCSTGGGSAGGENMCAAEESDCLDGKIYGVSCTVEMTTMTCTCQVDRQDGKQFTLEGTCAAQSYLEVVNAECGFPEGVLPPPQPPMMDRVRPSPRRLPPRLQRKRRLAHRAKRR